MTTTLHVVPPPDYGCPPWCEVGDGHPGNDGDGGPFFHNAGRCVPYAAADRFIVGGKIHQNPLAVDLTQDPGDAAPHVLLFNEDEMENPVHLRLTVPEAALLAEVLTELVATARKAQ